MLPSARNTAVHAESAKPLAAARCGWGERSLLGSVRAEGSPGGGDIALGLQCWRMEGTKPRARSRAQLEHQPHRLPLQITPKL